MAQSEGGESLAISKQRLVSRALLGDQGVFLKRQVIIFIIVIFLRPFSLPFVSSLSQLSPGLLFLFGSGLAHRLLILG